MAEGKTDYFAMLRPSARVQFLLAVFFIFAPVSLLFSSSFAQQRPWSAVAISAGISGMLAVCWAGTFTISRWFAPGIAILTVAVIYAAGPGRTSAIGVQEAGASWQTVAVVVAIVLGYVLFVLFIGGQGRDVLRLSTEMALARRIHDTLVPPVRLAADGVEALGRSVPSTEMGGDLIDVVRHPDGTVDLFLADVSGHGVRAGVVMGMLKAAIRTKSLRPEPLADLLADLNAVLDDTTSPELYATLAVVRVAPARDRLHYAVAGHHPILLLRADGTVERLGDRGFPLGLMSGSRYDVGETAARPGDLLALYTDGLHETADAADVELGHEAIEGALRGQAPRPLAEIVEAVMALVAGHGPQLDDRTLLLARLGAPIPSDPME